MANYIIAYMATKNTEKPEPGQAEMKKWQAWVAGLGDAVVNPGTPLMHSKTVSSEGVIEGGQITGYSVVEAESMEGALEMAKSCPYLEMGTVEVAEMMTLK